MINVLAVLLMLTVVGCAGNKGNTISPEIDLTPFVTYDDFNETGEALVDEINKDVDGVKANIAKIEKDLKSVKNTLDRREDACPCK